MFAIFYIQTRMVSTGECTGSFASLWLELVEDLAVPSDGVFISVEKRRRGAADKDVVL